MRCGAGCAGGKPHSMHACSRLETFNKKRKLCDAGIESNIVRKNNFVVEARSNEKRWRIVATPLHRAEVWRVKTVHPDGVPAVHTVLVGPAFPGTLLPIQGLVEAGTHIKCVASVAVDLHGGGFKPRGIASWNALPSAVWENCAASPCAWARIFTKVSAPRSKATAMVEPHTQLFVDADNPTVTQLPPLRATRNGVTRCCYCGTAYSSREQYLEKCVPDAAHLYDTARQTECPP